MLDPTMIILQGDIRQSPTPLYVKANSALKKASMVPMISAAGTLTTIRTVNNLSCYTRRLSRYVPARPVRGPPTGPLVLFNLAPLAFE